MFRVPTNDTHPATRSACINGSVIIRTFLSDLEIFNWIAVGIVSINTRFSDRIVSVRVSVSVPQLSIWSIITEQPEAKTLDRKAKPKDVKMRAAVCHIFPGVSNHLSCVFLILIDA